MSEHYNCCFVIPAYNEAANIADLLGDIQNQKTKYRVTTVVVDNYSTDDTRKIALNYGANVSSCPIRSVGCVRQTGIEFARLQLGLNRETDILVQMDADSHISRMDFVEAMVTEYVKNPLTQVSVGPTTYVFPEGEQTVKLSRGKEFRKYFGLDTLEELFQKNNRIIAEYLLPAPKYPLLIGTNTAYRSSILNNKVIRFPIDNLWESVVFSIRVYQCISAIEVKFIPEQAVETSSRAITTTYQSESNLQTQLEIIRTVGHIKPFKLRDTIDPLGTVRAMIDQIDRETYKLKHNQVIAGIVDQSNRQFLDWLLASTPSLEYRPALHASTLKEISNKVAVIQSTGHN